MFEHRGHKTNIKRIVFSEYMVIFKWAKQTSDIKNIIRATHNPLKEWKQDPKGYFLIKKN